MPEYTMETLKKQWSWIAGQWFPDHRAANATQHPIPDPTWWCESINWPHRPNNTSSTLQNNFSNVLPISGSIYLPFSHYLYTIAHGHILRNPWSSFSISTYFALWALWHLCKALVKPQSNPGVLSFNQVCMLMWKTPSNSAIVDLWRCPC